MIVYVDTSAFLTVLDADDPNHAVATRASERMVMDRDVLVTSSYVVVETISVLHQRRGVPAVRVFTAELLPVVQAEWVDEQTHMSALSSVLAGARHGPSLVDCVSFEIINRQGIGSAFAFDRHFDGRGFSLIA